MKEEKGMDQNSCTNESRLIKAVATGTATGIVCIAIFIYIISVLLSNETIHTGSISRSVMIAGAAATFLGSTVGMLITKRRLLAISTIIPLGIYCVLIMIKVICFEGSFHGWLQTLGTMLTSGLAAYFLCINTFIKQRGDLKKKRMVKLYKK
jgi:hypothetical protein